jgi:glycosyltransferase involved in cell wall biosynthesis
MTHLPPPLLTMMGFRAGPGGIGRVMLTLIEALSDLNLQIELILPKGDHPDLASLGAEVKTSVIDFDEHDTAPDQLARYLSERKPKAVLSNKETTNRLLTQIPLQKERPLIAFRIGTNVTAKARQKNPLTARWKTNRLGKVYRHADCLIANSQGVRDELQRLLRVGKTAGQGPRILSIWNPVDRQRIEQLARQPLTHPWLNPKTGPIILSVGRLVRAKNFTLLVRAFAMLPPHLNARLLIVGSGSQHDRLAALSRRLGIAERIALVGHQPNPFNYLAAADLFVCSSNFEGANNALMEALTLGVPCLSTDCPSGPSEILDAGRYGTLVPVRNAKAMAHAMQALLEQPLTVSRETLRASATRFDPQRSALDYAQALGLIEPNPLRSPQTQAPRRQTPA